MFITYLIGVFILGMAACYFLGKSDDHVQEEFAATTLVAVLFWPLAIAVTILFTPFAIMLVLGARVKKKRRK